ncbi:MAG: RidA family protein [Acidobacteriales bacterium]|nr:RidA family protein [Terriglobales bacterium]
MLRIIRSSLTALVLLAAALSAAPKKVVQPKEFPTGRPFSPAILAGDTLYVSGNIGSDLKTGKIPESFEDEVKLCLENIGILLKAGGMSYRDVVSVQVYLTDMDQFKQMNAVYLTFFKSEPRPTRTTVGVTKLAGGAHAEITVTAKK